MATKGISVVTRHSAVKLASIWGAFGPGADGVSRDAWADAMFNNICTQIGYVPGVSPESRNPWKAARRIKPRQVQYLAWNSQMAPTAYPMDNDEWWRNYAHCPIPADHPGIASWTIPGTAYMDVGAVGYAEAWALWAVGLARKWERIGSNHWSGIFADSICYELWFPGISQHYGNFQNYRLAQEQFCGIVGEYVRKRGYTFGANVGVGGPGYAVWPAIFDHLDLAFMEHVYPDLPMDAAILDRTRKYALAVHADSRFEAGDARNAEIDALATQLGRLLGRNGYVTYAGDDARRISEQAAREATL